jgi:hypothetical protein
MVRGISAKEEAAASMHAATVYGKLVSAMEQKGSSDPAGDVLRMVEGKKLSSSVEYIWSQQMEVIQKLSGIEFLVVPNRVFEPREVNLWLRDHGLRYATCNEVCVATKRYNLADIWATDGTSALASYGPDGRRMHGKPGIGPFQRNERILAMKQGHSNMLTKYLGIDFNIPGVALWTADYSMVLSIALGIIRAEQEELLPWEKLPEAIDRTSRMGVAPYIAAGLHADGYRFLRGVEHTPTDLGEDDMIKAGSLLFTTDHCS